MNNTIIRDYKLTPDCITVTVRKQSQLVQIPIVRKDYEQWLFENDRLWWMTVHGGAELTAVEYWNEVFDELKRKDMADYIASKGLAGDAMKDTFSALQSICTDFKRSKDIFLDEQERTAQENDYYEQYSAI